MNLNRTIKVQSESRKDIIYLVDIIMHTCSCPDYERHHANIFAYSYNPDYHCKHLNKLISHQLNLNELFLVIDAIDGDIELFIKNYNTITLQLLVLQQHVIVEKKIVILK